MMSTTTTPPNSSRSVAARASGWLGIAASGFLLAACQSGATVNNHSNAASAQRGVEQTLDALHAAAARADEAAYFKLYTPDAVFLGTDATERWTLEEFKAYAKPHFAAGRGWTYTVIERHVTLGPDGQTAWFDERLQNAKLGECRGSGVLVHGDDDCWRIAQYNLTIPIPNELAENVAGQIRTRQQHR